MDGIHYGPGEGESLFGGRIVLKSGLEQLTVTESWFATARPGADLHFHREHSDSFYVLEGELSIRIGDEEHLVGPGGTVSAPPGFVHGFRSTMPTRFLNFHTPDARFAEHLRELDRGEPGGFDSVDARPGDGLTHTGAVLLHAGEGEALRANNRVATIKIGTDDLCLIEFELEPTPKALTRTATPTTRTRSTCSTAPSTSSSATRRSWPARDLSSPLHPGSSMAS